MKDPNEAKAIVDGISSKQYVPASACKSWEERIIYLIEMKMTDSDEFKSQLNRHGRQKLAKIWKDYVAKNKAIEER